MKLRIETCDNINLNVIPPNVREPGYRISVIGNDEGHGEVVVIAGLGPTKQAAFNNLEKAALRCIHNLTAAMSRMDDLVG